MTQDTALLLEGGGMRGLFTAGVLDTLTAAGVSFPHVVGVSSGSLNTIVYMTGIDPRDFISQGEKDGPFIRPWNLVRVRRGLLDTNRFFSPLEGLHRSIVTSGVRGWTTMTRARDAASVMVHLNGMSEPTALADRIRASCSIPVLMPQTTIDGEVYVDGGIVESIPIDVAESLGFTRHVMVLTQCAGYVKGRQHLELLLRTWLKPFPVLKEAMLTRHIRYNAGLERAERMEREGRAFVIRPDRAVIRRFETDRRRFSVAYDHGVEVARARLEELRRFLSAGDPREQMEHEDA